ncbi:hypothetical protein C8K36_101494 [Rhodococcus sp. OK519]|nr:hypothetical protein C8K36_101494 [Rhodococcus sp. OK519]
MVLGSQLAAENQPCIARGTPGQQLNQQTRKFCVYVFPEGR